MGIIKLTDSKYTGNSRDIKPSYAAIGASFYEYDTEDLYDKTIATLNGNNGWVKRVYGLDGGTESDSLKGKITMKTFQGTPMIVIMAGNDQDNFEIGDICLGIDNGRFKALKVESIPVSTLANFTTAVSGEFL